MHTSQDFTQLSDRDLLAIFYGNEVDLVLEACDHDLSRLVRETRAHPSVANQRLHAALEISSRALLAGMRQGRYIQRPDDTFEFFRHRLGHRQHEVLVALWLNAQHRVLEFDEMFRGTLHQAAVYPRELVKRGLELNAGALIIAHNHPSGIAEPSAADERVTRDLVQALRLVDIPLLDHVIVAGNATCSFANRGLLSSNLSVSLTRGTRKKGIP